MGTFKDTHGQEVTPERETAARRVNKGCQEFKAGPVGVCARRCVPRWPADDREGERSSSGSLGDG